MEVKEKLLGVNLTIEQKYLVELIKFIEEHNANLNSVQSDEFNRRYN